MADVVPEGVSPVAKNVFIEPVKARVKDVSVLSAILQVHLLDRRGSAAPPALSVVAERRALRGRAEQRPTIVGVSRKAAGTGMVTPVGS